MTLRRLGSTKVRGSEKLFAMSWNGEERFLFLSGISRLKCVKIKFFQQKSDFVLSKNIINLVYTQALIWYVIMQRKDEIKYVKCRIGAFFGPLIPLIGSIQLLILYYAKKVTAAFLNFNDEGWHASDFVGQSNSELSPAVQSLSRLTNVTFLSSTAFDHFLRLSCTCWLCHSRVS